jgi:hypothetical protein
MRNIWSRPDLGRNEYLFVDTDFLQRGEKMPEEFKNFILENRKDHVGLYEKRFGSGRKTLLDLFFPTQAEVVELSKLRGGRSKRP